LQIFQIFVIIAHRFKTFLNFNEILKLQQKIIGHKIILMMPYGHGTLEDDYHFEMNNRLILHWHHLILKMLRQ